MIKHLIYKLWSFVRHCYFHLCVILTLGFRGDETQEKNASPQNEEERVDNEGIN